MFFVFGKLKLRWWRTYSDEMRVKVFQALEKKFAKAQKRKALPIIINTNPDFSSAGLFCVKESGRCIYLNSYYVTDETRRFAALYTIMHEGRHAMQYEKAVLKEPKWYQFERRRWRTNWQAYVGSSEDSIMYENQVLERDADEYAIKNMKHLRFKYRKEKDFNEILKAREEKFEKDEKLAMEKYGFFAKWHIHFKIRQRAKKRAKHRYN